MSCVIVWAAVFTFFRKLQLPLQKISNLQCSAASLPLPKVGDPCGGTLLATPTVRQALRPHPFMMLIYSIAWLLMGGASVEDLPVWSVAIQWSSCLESSLAVELPVWNVLELDWSGPGVVHWEFLLRKDKGWVAFFFAAVCMCICAYTVYMLVYACIYAHLYACLCMYFFPATNKCFH